MIEEKFYKDLYMIYIVDNEFFDNIWMNLYLMRIVENEVIVKGCLIIGRFVVVV